jgi:hypothetical protein
MTSWWLTPMESRRSRTVTANSGGPQRHEDLLPYCSGLTSEQAIKCILDVVSSFADGQQQRVIALNVCVGPMMPFCCLRGYPRYLHILSEGTELLGARLIPGRTGFKWWSRWDSKLGVKSISPMFSRCCSPLKFQVEQTVQSQNVSDPQQTTSTHARNCSTSPITA